MFNEYLGKFPSSFISFLVIIWMKFSSFCLSFVKSVVDLLFYCLSYFWFFFFELLRDEIWWKWFGHNWYFLKVFLKGLYLLESGRILFVCIMSKCCNITSTIVVDWFSSTGKHYFLVFWCFGSNSLSVGKTLIVMTFLWNHLLMPIFAKRLFRTIFIGEVGNSALLEDINSFLFLFDSLIKFKYNFIQRSMWEFLFNKF